jgi:hypothetical protein
MMSVSVPLPDNDPRSPIIQRLPKPIAVLMVRRACVGRWRLCPP